MSSPPKKYFVHFNFTDPAKILLLRDGLRWWMEDGTGLTGEGLLQIQRAAVQGAANLSKRSPLLKDILLEFIRSCQGTEQEILAAGQELDEFATEDVESPDKPGYQAARMAWDTRIPRIPTTSEDDEKSDWNASGHQHSLDQQILENDEFGSKVQEHRREQSEENSDEYVDDDEGGDEDEDEVEEATGEEEEEDESGDEEEEEDGGSDDEYLP